MKKKSSKIVPLDTLAKTLTKLRRAGKKIAHCHGCFDLMHPGHIKHFQAAKDFADVLVVTVTPDQFIDKGPGRPVFTQALRCESIAALDCVDYVAVNKWPTAEDTLRLLRPNYYVKGQEFKNLQDKTGKIQREVEVVKEVGAKFKYTEEVVFSSTKLINQHFSPRDASPTTGQVPKRFVEIYPEQTRQYLAEFGKKYSFDTIAKKLDVLNKMKVLLVGDGIIDEYDYCGSMGRSTKAPLIVNRFLSRESFAGGAFAIANHLSGICKKVHITSLLGRQDSREDFIRANLRKNVEAKFFYRDDGPTVIKRRYIEQYLNQKLFEVNFLNNEFIDEGLEHEVINYLYHKIADYDLVLVSDFGHGFITRKMIRVAERRSDTFTLCVNSQTNAANAGYNLITKYSRPSFVCLDEPEARLATQERFAPAEEVATKLSKMINTKSLIVTLGKRGSVGVDENGKIERCPVFSTKVVDTVGAGDAFFAFTSLAFAGKLPLDMISFIGNIVGALKVQTVCNKKPVEKEEVLDFAKDLLS